METPEATPEERPERETSLTREALGFVPGVGTALDVADIAQDVREKDYVGAGINTAAAVLGLIPGVGRVAGKGLKAASKAFRQADIDDAKKLMDDPDAKAAWQKESKNPFKQKRVPEVQEAAEKLSEGKITSREYRDTVKAYQPIQPITDETFPKLPTLKEIAGSLDKDKVAKGIVGVNKNIPDGTRVGSRLDIPAYQEYNTWVVSLHDGTKLGGNVIGYGQTAILKNVEFMTAAKGGLKIAKGASKNTIGRIHGDYFNADPEDVHELSKKLLNDPEWTQVGMNPFRHSFFYNKATGKPVFKADEVIQVGPLVLAKGVKTPSVSDLKTLKIKTPDKKIRMFNKGGDTMEEQMNFAFMQEGGVLADDGVDRDPVSGNEVPSGSMAEEVRDDIPAMLSEGEYVVPADVVRYHGIQKFEDLRNEAKVGLQRMEADGRIGGQPVQEQDELPFSIEELQVTEAYRGGIMGFQEGGDTGSYEEAFGQSYVPNQRYGSMGASGLGFQLRNFTSSKTGKKITVPFFNGKPMQYIPPEYTASDVAGSGVTGAVSDDASRQEDEAEKARLVNQFGTSPTELTPLAKSIVDKVIAGEPSTPQAKPFSQYSPEDFGNYLKQRQSGIGRVFDNLPIVGLLTTMQDNAAREFARKSLIQGKNFVTGEPITNKEADILMQVADMPEGKSLLSTIESFLTGKPSIEIDDRPPIDTELRRTTYEPQTPLDTQQDVSGLYGRGFTPEQIGDDPAVTQQNIIPTEQVDALPESPEKKSLMQKMKDVGYNVLTGLSQSVGPAFGGGLEGLDFSALDSEAYNVGLRDYNALSDKEQNRVKRLVRSEAIGEGDLGMAAVFRSVLTRYGLTKTGAVPLNTFNPGINLSGTNTQAPAALTKENLTFNDIIDGRRAKRDGNVIFQYSPVDDKSINKPLTKTQREAVDRSIALATNTTELAKELYKQDLNQDQVFEIINATNFRRFDAPGADTKNPKLFDHLFDSGGNQPFKANVQQIKDLTNKALQLDKPAVQPQTGFQNIIEPQPVDPTGLYGRGFTPSDIQPLEIEEVDLPPAEGVTPAVEVIEGGTTGSKARRDTQLRPDTQTGVNQFLTPTDVSAGSAARIDDDMARAGFGSVSAATTDTSPVSKLLTQGEDPYAPPDQPRQVTDPKAFLRRREQDRLKAEAAEKARLEAEAAEKARLEAEAAEKARLEAEAAERARLQRIAQEKKIYEETQARIAKQMKDAAMEQQQKKDTVSSTLEALKKDREKRDRIKKTNQMNQARSEVIQSGGSAFEADAAAHAVFLDQSDAIRRNEELNKGKTLTQVIQEENRREEDSGGGSGGGGGFGGGSSGGDDKIVCTEMYRQTQLVDWQKAMKIWDVYQRRYLTPEHQIGYHWLFKPYVKGMQRNRLLTKLGAVLAKRRTQHLKHILTKGKAKDDLVGKLWCSIIHPIVHKAGKIKNFLDSKTKAT